MSSEFLRADGGLDLRAPRMAGWLPTRGQMAQGAQAQFDQPLTAPPEDAPPAPWQTSMRQGMGMVMAAALVAGILPVLLAWIQATRAGTVLPLAQLSELAAVEPVAARWLGPFAELLPPLQTLAGMEPAVFPGWLAALLSAVGVWIGWPLRWLTWWIVYGLGVMVAAKLLGTTTTLQRFYSLTAYAALPLILVALGPIPCVGLLATLIALGWALVVYVAAARAVTGFSLARTLVAVALPGAIAVMFWLMSVAAAAVTLVRLSF